MIGTALASTFKLKVRFRYAHFLHESYCSYDSESFSLEFYTPNFVEEEEDITLPLEAYIDVTMDGEHYVTCEKTFLIYPDDIFPDSLNPKCASIAGKCSLEMSVDLRSIDPKWFWNLTVGFLPKSRSNINRADTPNKPNRESLDESRISAINETRNEEHD